MKIDSWKIIVKILIAIASAVMGVFSELSEGEQEA